MTKKQTCIFLFLITVLLAAGAFCGYLLVDNRVQQAAQAEVIEELAATVEPAQQAQLADDSPSARDVLLSVYRELAQRNPDMAGWIRIDGTTVNYPVMQTPDEPNYYLRRNFFREYSELGTPYIQENCRIGTDYNLVLYGHHMLAGGMFSDLELFKDAAFWKAHRTVRFDTLEEIGEYEILAVIKTVSYAPESFRYYEYTGSEDDGTEAKEFAEYVAECKARALYDTGVTAQYGDRLITLSTCEYSAENGRLVVVAKKIPEDETQ